MLGWVQMAHKRAFEMKKTDDISRPFEATFIVLGLIKEWSTIK
jgi:hypothetical protein